MPDKSIVEAVRELFDGKPEREIRAISVEALRRWRTRDGQVERSVQMHGTFGLSVIELLSEAQRRPIAIDAAKEVFLTEQHQPFMAAMLDFVWWLIRAGLARPGAVDAMNERLLTFRMTDAGIRFLDSTGDHPLSPDFLSRLRQRHPDIAEAIIVLLEDAHACLGAALVRPAVVLLGVAYETAIEAVLMGLATKALADEKAIRKADAGDRISMLKSRLSKLSFRDDVRRMTEAAVAFADHLRVRRNDAAHTTPSWPFDVPAEVEELLVSAARHLPLLWGITKATPL